MKKMPPIEKAYEAYSAIADGRVEMHDGYALVASSDGVKTYEVAWEGDVFSSNDNATYWQGYAGYPVLAVLILQGRLPKPTDACLADLAGIPWNALNEAHKRDYAAAAADALADKPHADEIRAAAHELYEALGTLDLTVKRGRAKHAKEVATDTPNAVGTVAAVAADPSAKLGTYKFVSWNIDSLNAALTGTSPRSELTRDVLRTIAAEDPDVIAIQETKLPAAGMNKKQEAALAEFFPGYDYVWTSSHEPARKGYAGTMALYKKGMDVTASYPEIGAPEPMDCEGRLITLDLGDLYFNLVYTPNAGDGLRRLTERQVWDKRYADYLAELDAEKPGGLLRRLQRGARGNRPGQPGGQPPVGRLHGRGARRLQPSARLRLHRQLPPCARRCRGRLLLVGPARPHEQGQQLRLENRLLPRVRPHRWPRAPLRHARLRPAPGPLPHRARTDLSLLFLESAPKPRCNERFTSG